MFGDLVRDYRSRLGLTQEELADQTGLGVRTLRDLEAGHTTRPRPATVRVLAAAFDLSDSERTGFVAAARAIPARAATSRSARAEPRKRERGSRPPARPPRPVNPAPAQLPPDIAGFAGRAEHLGQLDALLSGATRITRATPSAVVITAVSGTAGVGKTTLAIHWAHRVARRFPDGQLYVNLRGFDPTGQAVTPTEATRGFLDALGVPPERIPTTAQAQTGLYRTLLAGKRTLIILDNARDAEQIRPLLPGTPTALVLITSRDQLTPLIAADHARPLTLDLLTAAEATTLLANRLGSDRVTAEPAAVDAIITACAGLPLALAITAARAQQSGFSLTALAADLNLSGNRLDALDAGDPTAQVRAVLSWSYATLSPAAARLFRLLGLHPGPDTTIPAAASLAGLSPTATRRLLTELVRANLLVEPTPGRYTRHDLLRAYATELADTHDSADTRQAALARLLDHYVHTAHAANRQVSPVRDPIPLPLTGPAPGVTLDHPADDSGTALTWLASEYPTLLAAANRAIAAGLPAHAWQLAWTLETVLDRHGRWQQRAAAWQAALTAAELLDDLAARAEAHRCLASALTWLGDYAPADDHLRRALDLFTRAGHQLGQAQTHHDLARRWHGQGRPDKALHHAQQTLALVEAIGHPRGQAVARNTVGWFHTLLGDHAEALIHCERALVLHQQVADREGEAGTWHSLGYAHQHLGHHPQAIECYQRAISLYRDLGDSHYEACTLSDLGEAHQAAGQAAAARSAWEAALDLLTGLDHPDAAVVRAKLSDLSRPQP